MDFDSEGLSDFGTGAFTGAATGAKVSGGNPYMTAGGALAGGALSFFGGAGARRTEKRNNETALALDEFDLGEKKRAKSLDIERQRRMQQFGELLTAYFQRQQGGL